MLIRQQARPGFTNRTIVYCSIVAQTSTMANILNCEAFDAQQADRPGTLERFRRGPGKVLVARNALGFRIGILDIRCVTHLGWPRTMLRLWPGELTGWTRHYPTTSTVSDGVRLDYCSLIIKLSQQ